MDKADIDILSIYRCSILLFPAFFSLPHLFLFLFPYDFLILWQLLHLGEVYARVYFFHFPSTPLYGSLPKPPLFLLPSCRLIHLVADNLFAVIHTIPDLFLGWSPRIVL